MTTPLIMINLGCGYDPLPEYVNVDHRALPTADVVHDLDVHPWPFPDRSAVAIRAYDIFEHLIDVVGAMNECARILMPRGVLTIRGPLPTSENLWADVSHRRAFTVHSFDHFDWSTELGAHYKYGDGRWKIVRADHEGSNAVFELVRHE